MEQCLELLIPSLFPMLVISSFFISCSLNNCVKKRLHSFFVLAFGLSGNASDSIIAGLTGGYNIASKGAVKLFKEGKITLKEAQRLCIFFTSPGLSFCINIAGNVIFRSTATGIRIYLCCVSANIICSILYRLISPLKPAFKENQEAVSFSVALCQGVESASRVLINICSWVCFYNVLYAVCENFAGKTAFFRLLSLLGEVSSGLLYSSVRFPLHISVFVLSFGGVCIFLQQLPDVSELKIHPLIFLSGRLSVSTISSLIFYFTEKLFPLSVASFSQDASVIPFSHSPTGSGALMVLCAVFLYSMSSLHKELINRHKSRQKYNNRTCPRG